MSQNRPKYNRRDAIRVGAAGAAAIAGLSAVRRARGDCPTTVSETEGPYWVDEMLNRADVRSDPSTGVLQAGLPLRLALNISETTAGVCSPLVGAYVDIWHCNATGAYSDEPAGMGNPNTQGQKWLRGYQVTDAHGNVRFLTVYPGWYMGRTVHIHYRIRRFSGTTTTFNFTSQLYFDDAISNSIFARMAPYTSHPNRNPASNSQDGLYNSAMLLRLADNGTHAVASFNAIVDSTPGVVHTPGALSMDEESIDHMNDFGGGTPPLHLRVG
jgi:protocatechuate 3,4-dioxygenase beta subunit